MFFVNCFLVACIATLAAGEDYKWLPQTISTASEQCIKAGKYQGVCNTYGNPHDPQICAKMLCAQFTGRHHVGIPIRAMTGTICDKSSVCQNYKCVPVPPKKLPKETGAQVTHDCK